MINKRPGVIDLEPMSPRFFHALLAALKCSGVSDKINRCWLPPVPRLRKILEIYGKAEPGPIRFNVRLSGDLVHISVVGWTPERFAAAPEEK